MPPSSSHSSPSSSSCLLIRRGSRTSSGCSKKKASESSSSPGSTSVTARRRDSMYTAKLFPRHFVSHDYHDYATVPPPRLSPILKRKRGGVLLPFPLKLHLVLNKAQEEGFEHIISWQPHGRCFVIHEPNKFVHEIMPKYFSQSKLTSFQRQLNLYGFQRLTRTGPDVNGYYHEWFLRGRSFLCHNMTRTRVKGTYCKGATNPDAEPNFYAMPYVVSMDSEYQPQFEYAPTMNNDEAPIKVSAALMVSMECTEKMDSTGHVALSDKNKAKTTPWNSALLVVEPSNATMAVEAASITPVKSKRIVSTTLAPPTSSQQDTMTPCAINFVGAYKNMSCSTTEQREGGVSTKNTISPLIYSPSRSTHVFNGSIPLSMDTDSLCVPNPADSMCHDMHIGNITAVTTTETSLYPTEEQPACDLSPLLDDFVYDWLPNLGSETTVSTTTSTSTVKQQTEIPWQDESLRSMLDVMLTDEDPVASVVVPL